MAATDHAGERVLLRLKPAWKSFFVYYVAAGFLVAVAFKEAFAPEAGRPFPLSPPLTLLLAAAVLAYVVFKRLGTEFIVDARRARRTSALGLSQELELADIDRLEVYQTLVQRHLLGTGKVVMAGSRNLASRMQFFGIENPRQVKETIARLISEAKA